MSNNTDKKAFNILIVSPSRELAEDLPGASPTKESKELTVNNHRVLLDVFAGEPSEDASFKDRAARAQAVVILVRFLDVLSLDRIRNVYHYLTQAGSAPNAVFYLREEGGLDFKISCPACGQKLWLRDTDVGKRGRCPNCDKPFVILSQADHLRSQLLLPAGMPCLKVICKDIDSFRAAIAKLLADHAGGLTPADASVSMEALKQATVRIQVQDV